MSLASFWNRTARAGASSASLPSTSTSDVSETDISNERSTEAAVMSMRLIVRLNRVKRVSVRMRPAESGERCVKVDPHERSGSQAS